MQAFKNQRFKRGRKTTGKFYIIIDEPDADHLRWHKGDWEKLYSAAKHYQAKIILLIRDGSNDKELLKYFFVNSSNIVQLQEAHKALSMPTGSKRWIDSKKIPGSLLTELRRLPLFRLAIDNRLWRLSNQTLSSNETLTSCFRNVYYLAWLKVNGDSPEAAATVRRQLEVIPSALREGCAGQLPEIYDGADPVLSKGCFAQAWSVGELLRVYKKLEEIENYET